MGVVKYAAQPATPNVFVESNSGRTDEQWKIENGSHCDQCSTGPMLHFFAGQKKWSGKRDLTTRRGVAKGHRLAIPILSDGLPIVGAAVWAAHHAAAVLADHSGNLNKPEGFPLMGTAMYAVQPATPALAKKSSTPSVKGHQRRSRATTGDDTKA
jgi:hypothetical protein